MMRQKGGCPKGNTIKSSQAELERYKKAVAEAAQDYKNALEEDGEKQVLHVAVNGAKDYQREPLIGSLRMQGENTMWITLKFQKGQF